MPFKDKNVALEEIQNLAIERGGICLSPAYKNGSIPMRFRCKEGHAFSAKPQNLIGYGSKPGTWCPKCGKLKRSASRRKSPEKVFRIIRRKRGVILGGQYETRKSLLLIRCEHGHQFSIRPKYILQGQWCLKCSKQRDGAGKATLINVLRAFAKDKGGILLSRRYRNNREKLEWKCGNQHRWLATWTKVRAGRWCPRCRGSLSERLCRAYFEGIFDHDFPATKELPWLLGEKGRILELDGYCPDLKLAFEHQGNQHYTETYMTRSRRLAQLQKRDALKRTLCRQHGIKLIEVPELGTLTPFKQAHEIIVSLCRKQNVKVPRDWASKRIDLTAAYFPNERRIMQELRAIARHRGGRLITKDYVNNQTPMEWKCRVKSHPTFQAPAANIRGNPSRPGSWCRRCGWLKSAEKQRGRKKTLKDSRPSKG
jgi:hypothetical protein